MSMRFAHMADCHIGSWREPKLSSLSAKAFVKAVDLCIQKNADFILISGDLFNTSLPAVDNLNTAVQKLKELKDNDIPVYIVAGSHDYSASGKTMLGVLESAGLVNNVVKGRIEGKKLRLDFTTDQKTGAKICGMIGKKGMLEKKFYEDLDRESLEAEEGFKIFMFHTALTELKPKSLEKMDSAPVSLLPKGFDYYAAGHVHEVIDKTIEGYGRIIYPGPLFPNSFRELEKLESGGFFFYENKKTAYEPVRLLNVFPIEIDCSGLSPEQINEKLLDYANSAEFYKTIVTIRLRGTIKGGKIKDINFSDVINLFYSKGAYFIMKNTAALCTEEFEEIKIKAESVWETEDVLIKEHSGQGSFPADDIKKEKEITKNLLNILNTQKEDGETNAVFESRIRQEAEKALKEIIGEEIF